MKRSLLLAAAALGALLCACQKTPDKPKVYEVSVALSYPEELSAAEGVCVKASSSIGDAVFEAQTDAQGIASFSLTAGIYEFSAGENRTLEGGSYILLNGVASNVAITNAWNSETDKVEIPMNESKLSQIIIKELYAGGCPKDDDPSKSFAGDKYVILYNNSPVEASLKNICLAITKPDMSATKNKDYDADGKLVYEDKGVMPLGFGAFWSFDREVILEPYSQAVVVINGAIDNTATYSQSVNLSDPSYFVTYNAEQTTNATMHPAPSENIPTTNYLSCYNYKNPLTSWGPSPTGPGFFIFAPKDGATAQSFLEDTSNEEYYGSTSTSNLRKDVPVSWILDGIECFKIGASNNAKRFPASIDMGYVYMINAKGYSMYRNVDKDATLAIEGNADKLVYNYALGTESEADLNDCGSTDPSGIDAEASIAAGAKIVYQDTNNSTADFHLRKTASLRK